MTNLLKVRKSEKVTRKKICGILELQKPRTTGFTEFQDLGVPGFWNHEFSESLSSKTLECISGPTFQPHTSLAIVQPLQHLPLLVLGGESGGEGSPKLLRFPGAHSACPLLHWLLPGSVQPQKAGWCSHQDGGQHLSTNHVSTLAKALAAVLQRHCIPDRQPGHYGDKYRCRQCCEEAAAGVGPATQ